MTLLLLVWHHVRLQLAAVRFHVWRLLGCRQRASKVHWQAEARVLRLFDRRIVPAAAAETLDLVRRRHTRTDPSRTRRWLQDTGKA